MISRVNGTIKFKGSNFLVVEANGVGYKIFVSTETLRTSPNIEEKISLWTHLHVRENLLDLYGFERYAELEFFELIISISGIGPKSGLAVLSVCPLDVLKRAISAGETTYLIKVSGIGRKLAEKIIMELKDKLSMGLMVGAGGDGLFEDESEAIEALQSLGYSLRESRDALKNVSKETKGIENLVKEALQNMHKKRK